MISLFAYCSTANRRKGKKRKEKKRKKKNEDTPLDVESAWKGGFTWTIVRPRVFGLLKQVNIAVEGKTKGAIFAPFSVSVILFSG